VFTVQTVSALFCYFIHCSFSSNKPQMLTVQQPQYLWWTAAHRRATNTKCNFCIKHLFVQKNLQNAWCKNIKSHQKSTQSVTLYFNNDTKWYLCTGVMECRSNRLHTWKERVAWAPERCAQHQGSEGSQYASHIVSPFHQNQSWKVKTMELKWVNTDNWGSHTQSIHSAILVYEAKIRR